MTAATQSGGTPPTLEALRSAADRDHANLDTALRYGHALLRASRFDEASVVFKRISGADPTNVGAVTGLGYAARRCGDLETAISAFRQALTFAPNLDNARLPLADLLLEQGARAEAESLYLQVLEGNPEELRALRPLVRMARERGELKAAIVYQQRVLALDPGNVAAMSNLAAMLRQGDRLDEAAETYKKILQSDSRHIQSLLALGWMARTRHDDPLAYSFFRAAMENPAAETNALVEVGNVFVSMNRLDEAEALYRRALTQESGSAKAWTGLGIVARTRRDWPTALECFRTAETCDPADQRIQLNVAHALFYQDDLDEAEAAYRRIIEAFPGSVDAIIGLAEIARLKGDRAGALATLSQAEAATAVDYRLTQAARLLKAPDADYDWRTEIANALEIVRSADAGQESQINAATTLVGFGLTDAAAATLARLGPVSAKARKLFQIAQELDRMGLSQRSAGGEASAISGDSELDALKGYIEKPVSGSDTLLIVFGGREHRFGVTFSLLHRILRSTAVNIVYVRDLPNNWYLGSIVGLGDGFDATVEGFRKLSDRYKATRILTLGNCFGCAGALRFGMALGAKSVLGLSPTIPREANILRPANRKKLQALYDRMPANYRDVRQLYESAKKKPDVTLVYGEQSPEDLADTKYLSDIRGIGSVAIPGLQDKSSVRELLLRRLLDPMLREFVDLGTISPHFKTRISTSIDLSNLN